MLTATGGFLPSFIFLERIPRTFIFLGRISRSFRAGCLRKFTGLRSGSLASAITPPLELHIWTARQAGADLLFEAILAVPICIQALRSWTTLFAFRPVIASSM